MSARVDFAQVRLIPFLSVLSTYKVEVRKRSNTEFVAQCPFPSHTSKKHEWTLAISTDKGKFFCHSETCRAASNKPKGGDVIDFVCMVENTTALDAAKRLSEVFCIGNGVPKDVSKDTTTPPSKPLNPPLNFELKHLDSSHPYIAERGISLETAIEFGIGYHSGKGSMAGRICFPLYENGALVGYAGRWVGEPTPDNPKWRLPLGLHRTFLYGLERCEAGRLLHLCESAWGVLWFYQHGIQAAALIGCSLTEEQEALLEPYADIRICMDNDDAGRAAAVVIVERLKAKHRVTKAFLKG